MMRMPSHFGSIAQPASSVGNRAGRKRRAWGRTGREGTTCPRTTQPACFPAVIHVSLGTVVRVIVAGLLGERPRERTVRPASRSDQPVNHRTPAKASYPAPPCARAAGRRAVLRVGVGPLTQVGVVVRRALIIARPGFLLRVRSCRGRALAVGHEDLAEVEYCSGTAQIAYRHLPPRSPASEARSATYSARPSHLATCVHRTPCQSPSTASTGAPTERSSATSRWTRCAPPSQRPEGGTLWVDLDVSDARAGGAAHRAVPLPSARRGGRTESAQPRQGGGISRTSSSSSRAS